MREISRRLPVRMFTRGCQSERGARRSGAGQTNVRRIRTRGRRQSRFSRLGRKEGISWAALRMPMIQGELCDPKTRTQNRRNNCSYVSSINLSGVFDGERSFCKKEVRAGRGAWIKPRRGTMSGSAAGNVSGTEKEMRNGGQRKCRRYINIK